MSYGEPTIRRLVAGVCVVTFSALAATAAQSRTTSPCGETETRVLFSSFLGAFTRSDAAAVESLFVAAPRFGWFSSNYPGLRRGAEARSRSSIRPYVEERHRRRDRVSLLDFVYRGGGNFTYTLRRAATDYDAGAWFRLIGKGAATCEGGDAPRLVVVSLGAPGSDGPARPCNVTRPTRGSRPPAGVPRSFNYGNETIAVALSPPSGKIVAGRLAGGGVRATIRDDGTIEAKVGWWRAGDGGIRISGRRLDARARPLAASVPSGYGTGFQATGLRFPTPGCWRVTGSYAGSSLSFTVLVALSPLGP